MGVIKMKLFYAIAIVLVVFVSACVQQTEQPPVVSPETGSSAEPEAPVQTVEEAPEAETGIKTTSNDVRILGKGGFDPMELTIAKGSAVTFYNDAEKTTTMVFYKDDNFYMNSPILEPGDQFENEFTEAGEYKYWTLAYGVEAKIIVE
jgi:plastocyanin